MTRAMTNVAVGAIALLLVLALESFAPKPVYERGSRGCVSNRSSVDKCVGVWESQHEAIPRGAHAIVIGTHGTVLARSADRSSIALPSGKQLFDYTKDINVFCCPSGDALDRQPEQPGYVWLQDERPLAALGSRKRGVLCLVCGPDAR